MLVTNDDNDDDDGDDDAVDDEGLFSIKFSCF